jgi:hypothetical protein
MNSSVRLRSILWLGLLGFLIFAASVSQVQAGLTLVYEGSFNLPSAVTHYYQRATFVPNGNTRPGNSVPVTGPSLVIGNSHSGVYIREVNNIPVLSKTLGGMGTATTLTNTLGGTQYSGATYRYPQTVDSAGNMWNPYPNNGYYEPRVAYKAGSHVLGTNTEAALSVDTGWPGSSYLCGNGVLRRGDGAGGDLPTDGTTIGAKFVVIGEKGVGGRSSVFTWTRTGTTAGTHITNFNTVTSGDYSTVRYVRDTASNEYFMVFSDGSPRTNNNLKFFASGTTGSNDTPTATYDVDTDITNGPGWLDATYSLIRDVSVDWPNSKLYVLEATISGAGNTRAGRMHVFTAAAVPTVQTLSYQNCATNTCDLVGRITDSAATDVICYWGTNDRQTSAALWQTNLHLGPYSAPVTITNSVGGLLNGTVYYFRFFASNSVAGVWATNSLYFTTLGADTAVKVNNSTGADNITSNSATLKGTLTGGDPNPRVWIYWGTSEGATNKTGWDMPVIDKGERPVGPFDQAVSGLLANKQYFYRCYASNVNEQAWADAATNFTTLSPYLTISDATVNEGPASTTTTAVFTVTISVTSGIPVSVNYSTANGSATTADNDYQPTNGTLTIPAGSVTGMISVVVVGNNLPESDETFTVNLDTPVGVAILDAQGLGTIVNDDMTYYVRGDGSGSDANSGVTWSTAWATLQKALDSLAGTTADRKYLINVQASSGAQAYQGAYRSTDIGQDATKDAWADFLGGWENVDAVASQTGYTVVADTNGAVDTPGFAWSATGGPTTRENTLGSAGSDSRM